MRKSLRFALILAFTTGLLTSSSAQNKASKQNTPECSPGAICFSGEVSRGHGFRKTINGELEFALGDTAPGDADWTIEITPTVPEGNCAEFAEVVTPPHRAHNSLEFDVGYGLTADDEVAWSPRIFKFVTNCKDWRTEGDRLDKVLWPGDLPKAEADEALAKLGTSPLGKGRLWITQSRVSHSSDTTDDKRGRIEWMRFTVEILLPGSPATSATPLTGRPKYGSYNVLKQLS